MGFPRGALREKQRIVDEYLNLTGRNIFVPAEFLDWLRDHEDHPCYSIFYGQTDEAAAMEHRKDMVRRWVSGLRLKIRVEHPVGGRSRAVNVTEHAVPAMISPAALRRGGGGYYTVNTDDPAHVEEMAMQAAASLESWLDRNGGIAEMKGCDLAAIRQTVAQLRQGAHVLAAE